MKIAILTSLPSAAIQFIYDNQIAGITIRDGIFDGDDSDKDYNLKDFARIKGFNLYFHARSQLGTTHSNIAPDQSRCSEDYHGTHHLKNPYWVFFG